MKLPKSFRPRKNLEEKIKDMIKKENDRATSYKELLDYNKVYRIDKGRIIPTFRYPIEALLLPPILIDSKGKTWEPPASIITTQEHILYICKRDEQSAIIGYHVPNLDNLKIKLKVSGLDKTNDKMMQKYEELKPYYDKLWEEATVMY